MKNIFTNQTIVDTEGAEKAIIYCMVKDSEVYLKAKTMLDQSMFQSSTIAKLFAFITDEARKGDMDLATLYMAMSEMSDPLYDALIDTMLFGDQSVSVPTWGYASRLVDKLILLKKRNTLAFSLQSAISMCSDPDIANYTDLYTKVLGAIDNLKDGVKNQNTVVVAPEKLAEEFVQRMNESMDRTEEFIKTGFDALDKCIVGLKPEKLFVIGARPGMGKTALALNIAEHVAFDQKKRVLFVSFEMGRDELIDRIACVHMKKGTQFMDQRGNWDSSTTEQVLRVSDLIAESQLFICDEIHRDVDKLISLIKLQEKVEGVDVIIIDYLQLMTSPVYASKGLRVLEMGDITGKLKTLAREIKKPVILLSQLNREIEKRSVKRPSCADLRDSGSIEQDADVIIFINRNKPGDSEKREPELGDDEALIIVDKHRYGQPQNFVLGFKAEQTRFLNPVS